MSVASMESRLTGEVVDLQRTFVPDGYSAPAGKQRAETDSTSVRSLRQDGEHEAARAFRQSRLRAASSYLSIWWSIIAIQSLLTDLPYVLPFFLVFALGGAYVHLSIRPKIAPWGLKCIETGMFGLMAGAFIVFQCVIMVTAARHADFHGIEISEKNGLINSITLLLAYTLLIPNTLRSAAVTVVGLSTYPLITAAIILNWHPDVRALIEQHRYLEPSGLNVTMAIVAGTLSLYGIHILDTLRQDIFEARRLNQYQLCERLGAGGMGEVYLAEHRLLRRCCAVKMVHPEKSLDRRALAMLEREVQSTALLSHPNIVEIYDYGRTDDGSFYYVMERLHGLNLAELVEQHGPLPVSRIIYLLRQVCDGLAEAHAAGLVHRDLKPDNIFVAHIGRRADVAKILDFGLVKRSALPDHSHSPGAVKRTSDPKLTVAGTLMGTPLFMAPEQGLVSNSVNDHRADLYALGAIAYFLATGQAPFEGNQVVPVLMAHAYEPVVPPSHLLPVPADFERVVLRCLEKLPLDRYSSAEELGQAFSLCEAATDWNCQLATEWWNESSSLARLSLIAPR